MFLFDVFLVWFQLKTSQRIETVSTDELKVENNAEVLIEVNGFQEEGRKELQETITCREETEIKQEAEVEAEAEVDAGPEVEMEVEDVKVEEEECLEVTKSCKRIYRQSQKHGRFGKTVAFLRNIVFFSFVSAKYSSTSIEEQLLHVQEQLQALAKLPSTIQLTLNAVTRQLEKIASVAHLDEEDVRIFLNSFDVFYFIPFSRSVLTRRTRQPKTI